MKVYTILKNIITRFKSGISQCLADAKDYTDTEVSAVTEIEDFTSQVSVNATYYSMGYGSAKRVGNIGYLTYRLVIKTNFSNAQNIPILTLPHNVGNDLINFLWFFRSGSGAARPLMESVNNQIFEKYYGNAQSGDIVDFIFVYIVGGNT